MKKVEIILILVVGLLVVIVLGSALFLPAKAPSNVPFPIQIFSPSPSAMVPTAPKSSVPPELESEKIKQENYAKSRGEFLTAKPWLLKLPLKTISYFISYNPNNDTLIVELYYLENSSLTKDQQLSQAKQDAVNTMIATGIDINKQPIKYLELLKKQ